MALGVGSIILLVFFTLLVVYICVGMMYKKAVYSSEGCSAFPNIEFWSSLPGLIKDGYMFFLSPCLGDKVQYRTYQQIDSPS